MAHGGSLCEKDKGKEYCRLRGKGNGAQGACLGKVSKKAVSEKVTSKQTLEGGEGGSVVQIGETAGAKALGRSVPFTQMGKGCGKSIFLFWTCCIEAPSGH